MGHHSIGDAKEKVELIALPLEHSQKVREPGVRGQDAGDIDKPMRTGIEHVEPCTGTLHNAPVEPNP
jgi:hypothetical protein